MLIWQQRENCCLTVEANAAMSDEFRRNFLGHQNRRAHKKWISRQSPIISFTKHQQAGDPRAGRSSQATSIVRFDIQCGE
jgi:hypothetical protein